jgi:LmbE family N-acetylglucosaminyl deacetylase
MYQKDVEQSIILSPHCDDAMFSVGGRIFADRGRIGYTVINIFTQSFFTIFPKLSGSIKIISYLRKKEDERAFRNTGAKRIHLFLADALARKGSSSSIAEKADCWKDSARDQHVFDLILKKTVGLLEEMSFKHIYFPLAVGNHLDHILVRSLSSSLLKKKILKKSEIRFYEDIPYSLYISNWKDIPLFLTSQNNSLIPRYLDISHVWENKKKALSRYRSQINKRDLYNLERYHLDRRSLIFPSGGEIPKNMDDVEEKRLYECTWEFQS